MAWLDQWVEVLDQFVDQTAAHNNLLLTRLMLSLFGLTQMK